MADIIVKEVRLLNDTGGYRVVTPAEFLALPATERIKLILAAKVQFHDSAGNLLPTTDALRTLKS